MDFGLFRVSDQKANLLCGVTFAQTWAGATAAASPELPLNPQTTHVQYAAFASSRKFLSV